VKALEHVPFSRCRRSRRVALPSRTSERDMSSLACALPRDGVRAVAIATLAIAALVLGGLLGTKTGGATHSTTALGVPAATTPGADDAPRRQVIAALSAARQQGRDELADAATPAAQVAAAIKLARANIRAAKRLGSTQEPIARALFRTAGAYNALRLAAQKGDRAAFTRAAVHVEDAERGLESVLGSKF
jgi:hypothetical protein